MAASVSWPALSFSIILALAVSVRLNAHREASQSQNSDDELVGDLGGGGRLAVSNGVNELQASAHDGDAPAVAATVAVNKVDVLFVRHGLACHNALNYQGVSYWKGKFVHCEYPDPPLTDCGIRESEDNGKALAETLQNLSWQPQKIFSSSMIRAMETASAMFPNYTPSVAPLPFISELSGVERAIGKGRCNDPISLADQQNHFSSAGMDIDWQYVNTSFTLTEAGIARRPSDPPEHMIKNHKTDWSSDEARQKVKYKEFRAFLGEHVVPGLISSALGNTVKIVIVSHSAFLREKLAEKYFKCANSYFVNNDAMLLSYDYNQLTKLLTESASSIGTCLRPRPSGPRRVWYDKKASKDDKERRHDYLCPADYGTCWTDRGKKLMGDADGKPGDQSFRIKLPPTSQSDCCMNRAYL
jgi:bisphosphoglycerate-dependent phosphoglycerate mutase